MYKLHMFTTYINSTFKTKCQTLLFESNHVNSDLVDVKCDI